MEREKIDEILRNLNSLMDFEELNEDDIVEILKSRISDIEENLRLEDEDYFYDYLDENLIRIIAIKIFKDDDKKIEAIDKLTDDFDKVEVMQTIQDDDKKIEALDKLTYESYEAEVIKTIQNDDKKIEAMDRITRENLKAGVMSTIQDDDKKLEAIDTLTEEDNKAGVMRTIQEDDKKLKAIDTLRKEDNKVGVMITIQNDDKKIEALDKLPDEFLYQKADIISTIQDDDKKIEAINKLPGGYFKAQVMQTLEDDKKLKEIDKQTDEDTKVEIMKTIQDDDKKIEAIDKLTDESLKAEVIETIQDDDKKLETIDKLIDKNAKVQILKSIHFDDKKIIGIDKLTDEDAKAEILKTIYDKDKKIETAKKIYALNDRQTKILKQLMEKNEELLETIDFKILDERYSDLEGNLQTITCYQDIQEKILALNEQEYKIFIQTLKEYEKRNEKWINFTSKVISNLYDDQYKDLLNDIKDKNLTEDEIRNLGKIISKENIFTIKNLDEAKNYKEIKEKVCDIIIYDGNSEELKKYPKIMSLSELDRKKMAVLQKIYGQTLKEVNYLLETYGADIENLTVTSENEASILYIKSLQIIKNTDDIELLQNIYEKCKTIEIDNVHDIEMVEEQLKDSYLETYNKKLYEPKESDLIDIIEEEGKKIPIYNAGTDFSMSISSIGAYYADWIMNYKEEWNRPRIASQGYCASYIRNDMLGTAPIKEVVYGFRNYDKGTLIKSGRYDIDSDARRFQPSANRKVEFLSESTQIDNTYNGYNEMLFNRFNADGERRQPDYIVFIKEQETLERKRLGK